MAALTMGAMGLTQLEEQKKYLGEQAASGAISNSEYNAAVAKIDAEIATAKATVAGSPLKTSADTANISEGPSLYSKSSTGFNTLYDKNPSGSNTLYESEPTQNMYAQGGAVTTSDDQTNTLGQTPLTNIQTMSNFKEDLNKTVTAQQPMPQNNPLQNSGTGTGPQSYYNSQPSSGIGSFGGNSGGQGTFPLQGQYGIVKMAAGGMAAGRFLSGGGDGMSDSIHASIGGTQEARLADGEFVLPADVVSHLGNGSSKAGAKQLYSMMDKVRQARVGTKKQGKQINPRKYLAA
jgi:hypothetical protein